MGNVAAADRVDDGDGAAAGGAAASGAVPAEQRCIWPGCTRRRAAGRAAGSGRQKEYCLQADPPEAGGGPVHNARNRWAALRGAASRAPRELAGGGDDAPDDAAHPETATGSGEQAATVPDQLTYSAAKKRASDLLEQARRQHAAAIASLHAERELYQRLGEQLTALSDPASLDLEIAAIASRAGASVAQAEEDSVRARRAQLAAERERDDAIRLRGHADAAAEQLAADAEAAEAALAERTAAFDRDRSVLAERARDAEDRAGRDRAAAAAARTAAEQATAEARDQAAEQVTAAVERARQQVAAAEARADAQAGQARRDADAARRETATALVTARDTVERARTEMASAIADASTAIERARADAAAARDASVDAVAGAAAAAARADASAAEAGRAHEEIRRLRGQAQRMEAARKAEVARLTAAHQAALEAGRARVTRAETELDALRRAPS